ncbi:MAG: sugar phosphate nucleotidyltransferase [Alphaproteobacteria bacterium]
MSAPGLVMNGGILSKVDPVQMIDFHRESDTAATMAVRSYEVQVPCGVVDIDDHEIKGLLEKPVTRHFIYAGIYVLGPVALEIIPHDGAFDMPDLFEA